MKFALIFPVFQVNIPWLRHDFACILSCACTHMHSYMCTYTQTQQSIVFSFLIFPSLEFRPWLFCPMTSSASNSEKLIYHGSAFLFVNNHKLSATDTFSGLILSKTVRCGCFPHLNIFIYFLLFSLLISLYMLDTQHPNCCDSCQASLHSCIKF